MLISKMLIRQSASYNIILIWDIFFFCRTLYSLGEAEQHCRDMNQDLALISDKEMSILFEETLKSLHLKGEAGFGDVVFAGPVSF